MVLVFGCRKDPVIRAFLYYLHKYQPKQSKGFLLLDQQEFGSRIHADDKAWYVDERKWVQHEDVIGVWNRMLATTELPISSTVAQSIACFACYLMDYRYPQVLNRPKDAASNFAKCYQLGLCAGMGLNIPQTVIVKGHMPTWPVTKRRWVFKSMSSVRSKVQTLAYLPNLTLQLERAVEPVIWQKRILGHNIRVHVVGRKVFACLCISKQVDYRFDAGTRLSNYVLPPKIAAACLAISKRLKLKLAGIDLIKNKQGFWLLEVNTAPGYSSFYRHSVAVSRALFEYWY